ncbi:ABC transporter permease [Streptomyces collinus]|uniref:ABC transporter permease n=1 Tax=Streptomyces collinus TaxID=42684 RepID=UPI00367D4A9E
MTLTRAIRLVGVTTWMHLKMLNRSVYESVMQAVWPLFFATTALLMYRIAGDREALTYAALGASTMTIWTAVSSLGSGILERERGLGTLEILVASPTPFPLSVAAIVLAVSAVGCYGMLSTFVWEYLVFGVTLDVSQPTAFSVAALVTVFSFATLGFLLAVTVVRYREAWALGNILEYPVWLVCGFLVPVSLLPGWIRPFSWLLPPTAGMEAVRKAAVGENPWEYIAVCTGTTALFCLIGIRLTRTILHSARRHATFSLT